MLQIAHEIIFSQKKLKKVDYKTLASAKKRSHWLMGYITSLIIYNFKRKNQGKVNI